MEQIEIDARLTTNFAPFLEIFGQFLTYLHYNPLQGSTGKYRENPVMKTGNLQLEQGSPVMKAGFSLWELTYREKL